MAEKSRGSARLPQLRIARSPRAASSARGCVRSRERSSALASRPRSGAEPWVSRRRMSIRGGGDAPDSTARGRARSTRAGRVHPFERQLVDVHLDTVSALASRGRGRRRGVADSASSWSWASGAERKPATAARISRGRVAADSRRGRGTGRPSRPSQPPKSSTLTSPRRGGGWLSWMITPASTSPARPAAGSGRNDLDGTPGHSSAAARGSGGGPGGDTPRAATRSSAAARDDDRAVASPSSSAREIE